MEEKTKQILLDVLDSLNDSKYELENLEENDQLKNSLEDIIDELDYIINKIEELVK